jgi:hypothetical protein
MEPFLLQSQPGYITGVRRSGGVHLILLAEGYKSRDYLLLCNLTIIISSLQKVAERHYHECSRLEVSKIDIKMTCPGKCGSRHPFKRGMTALWRSEIV